MATGGCVIGASERAITVYVEDSVRMTSKKASPSAAINHSPRLPLSPLRSNYELEKNDSLSRKGNESADRTQIITTSGVENSTQDLSSYQWPQKLELNRFSSSWGEKIPIVDGEGLWSEDAGPRAKVVRDIGAACERWGFFQVVNHGVPPTLVQQLQSKEQAFLALPKSVKKRYNRTVDTICGYHDREVNGRLGGIGNWAEYFDVGPKPWVKRTGYRDNLGGVAMWPCELDGFRQTLEAYYQHMERLAVALLSAILESLPTDETPSVLAKRICANHNSLLRMVKYPRCPDPDHILGYNSHTDSGLLTVIQQNGVEGLQVKMDDEWMTIEPKEGHVVVNVGNMVQVLTNGIYRSSYHRVLASSTQERLSSPFFLMPAYETQIAPLEGLVSATIPTRYRPIPWNEFRGRRIRSERGDKSSYVAISEFEVSN